MIPRPVIPTLFPYTTLFRSDVGLDDGRDPGVSHHPPELDAIQKRDRAGGRREPLHCPYGMDLQLAVLDRIGPGELLDVTTTDARLRNRRGRNGARRDDRVDPGARHRQRVRSAQPRYVTLRSSVSTRRPLPSPARATPFISCMTMSFFASLSVSSAGVMNRAKS